MPKHPDTARACRPRETLQLVVSASAAGCWGRRAWFRGSNFERRRLFRSMIYGRAPPCRCWCARPRSFGSGASSKSLLLHRWSGQLLCSWLLSVRDKLNQPDTGVAWPPFLPQMGFGRGFDHRSSNGRSVSGSLRSGSASTGPSIVLCGRPRADVFPSRVSVQPTTFSPYCVAALSSTSPSPVVLSFTPAHRLV